MWVEVDSNLAGGEALIRQIIHGKRNFKDVIGVDSKLLWLPDVFGYSGSLPQILKKCGVPYSGLLPHPGKNHMCTPVQ
jgi:alpha-mannosidase